jgi:glucan-binding YG repeat protein
MKSIKRVLSFIMVAALVLGINVPVHAEWKQNNNIWTYANSDGTLKKEWFNYNGKWYYFNPEGNMVTGWMPFNGTWYYFQNDGSWDGSKTLTSVPEELNQSENKVEQYSKEKVRYLDTIVYENSQAYRFMPEGTWKYGTSTYYYVPNTGKTFQLTEGILVRLDVNQLINGKYTFDQCKNIANEAFKGEIKDSYSINSDAIVNKWGEYYFAAYSTNSNQQIDAFYVSGYNGQVRR